MNQCTVSNHKLHETNPAMFQSNCPSDANRDLI